MRAWLFFVSLTACGRIGIDERQLDVDAAQGDAMFDASPGDMTVTLACPADMTPLSASSSVCIDLTDQGQMLWLDGKSSCESKGRRYCTDAEWVEGCNNATNLVGITGAYEWVAEESGGIAQKRGSADCDDASSHVITDPYEVRCCGPMI